MRTRYAWFANFVGSTEPKYAIVGSLWVDTSDPTKPILKVRSSVDGGSWVVIGPTYEG